MEYCLSGIHRFPLRLSLFQKGSPKAMKIRGTMQLSEAGLPAAQKKTSRAAFCHADLLVHALWASSLNWASPLRTVRLQPVFRLLPPDSCPIFQVQNPAPRVLSYTLSQDIDIPCAFLSALSAASALACTADTSSRGSVQTEEPMETVSW